MRLQYNAFTNRRAHVACDLNFIVKNDGFFKVAGSHVQCKCGKSLKRWQQVTIRKWYTAYLIAAIAMTWSVPGGHLSIASLFKWDVPHICAPVDKISGLWTIHRETSILPCILPCVASRGSDLHEA